MRRAMDITRDMLGSWLWPVFWLGLVDCVVFWMLGVLAGALSCGLVPFCGTVVFVGGCVVDVLFCGVVVFVDVWLMGCVLFVGAWLIDWVLFGGATCFGFSSR
jgi:hypothetical protein